MEYRIHPRTGDKISVIGLGSAYIFEGGPKIGVPALERALEGGINDYDLAAGDGKAFPIFGEAFSAVRKDVFYQIHFGADYSKGTYGWSLALDDVKRSIDWQLTQLRTDYIDYGFIHCQDELSDWAAYQKNGVLDHLLSLKRQGMVRHLGLSSHTPAVIGAILDEIEVDTLMFSINAAYDYGEGEYANGSVDERAALYRRCAKAGIGITVMKPFSGGQLLDAALSPFGQALTPYQCIRYALDKPAVLTVLPGAKDRSEVEGLLAYFDQPEQALDYSNIASFAPPQAAGTCVYCNHCKPCPIGLDVGLINKYYDLAKAGDLLAREHYLSLEQNAADCIACGHCDQRCPFQVRQSARMAEIAAYFA